MSARRSKEEILRAWGRSAVPVDDAARTGERRDRAVAQIAQNIALMAEQRRRAARWRKRLGVLAVAAAALLVLWGGQKLLRRDPGAGVQTAHVAPAAELSGAANVTIERAGVRRNAVEAMALVAGDQVSAGAGAETHLILAGGAEVCLEPGSRIALGSPGGEALELRAGEITVHVPKLVAPASFVVRTPDARVVVHGTRFVVTVLEAGATPRTHVRVLEGRVGVEHRGEIRELELGQTFPPAPAPPPARTAVPSGPEPARASTAARAPAGDSEKTAANAKPSAEPPALAAADPAALAEQNRLFSTAVSASRRGDDRRAVALLDELMGRFPKSPILPEARVERFRALKRLGRDSEAAREASRYLIENENGAAKDEARSVVLP